MQRLTPRVRFLLLLLAFLHPAGLPPSYGTAGTRNKLNLLPSSNLRIVVALRNLEEFVSSHVPKNKKMNEPIDNVHLNKQQAQQIGILFFC